MTQKSVLITGANRGIGREAADQLARRGFHIVIGARDAAAADKVAHEIVAAGGSAEGLAIDVSDSESIHAATATFAKKHDKLDALINNAGIYIDKGVTILDAPRSLWEKTLGTNTFGPVEVAQAFLPVLKAAGRARIVNVSSGYGQLGGLSPDVPTYCLSKLALSGVTIMLAKALEPHGITVNSVCPGWVRSDMGGKDATRSVEEGADSLMWLVAEAPQELTGKFFRDRKEIPW
jgi:NAD(P)-dependent dehydrogenase (short-subunit alcohol dehydrogenase family)